MNTVFEAGQLFGADRTAGVEFAGGNPDLRAEAELAAVGELGRFSKDWSQVAGTRPPSRCGCLYKR